MDKGDFFVIYIYIYIYIYVYLFCHYFFIDELVRLPSFWLITLFIYFAKKMKRNKFFKNISEKIVC